MNNFLGPLDVRYIDGKRWEVRRGFTYRVGDPHGRYFITIPRGFVTDFASMPLNIVFRSPGGKWDKPAVVHDLLYRRGWIEHEQHRQPITRLDADQVFREAMEVAGVDEIRRTIIYAGVRLGGGKTWHSYREAEHVEKAS